MVFHSGKVKQQASPPRAGSDGPCFQQHFNWLGGRWLAAEQGGTFELAGGHWPRSGAGDLAEAERWLRQGGAWARMDRAARHGLLAQARDNLRADGGLAPELAGAFGLELGEAARHLDEDLFQLDQALELLRDGQEPAGAGLGLFRAHWSDRIGRLAARTAARLIAGHSVLLLADPLLPCAAEAWVRALERAGLPADALALCFADTSALFERALQLEGLAWFRMAGHAHELARAWERAPARLQREGSLWRLRNRSTVVLAREDPERAAEAVVGDAFGRVASLSGQLPGHTGRVVCHQARFSRFTESLLSRAEADPDMARALPFIEAGAFEHLRSSWELGLDEGATPIHGGRPGDPAETSAKEPPSGHKSEVEGKPFGAGIPPSYLGVQRRRGAMPLIFTNVEPHQRLARLGRPEPLLRLIRAPSDEAARELAGLLDRAREDPE